MGVPAVDDVYRLAIDGIDGTGADIEGMATPAAKNVDECA